MGHRTGLDGYGKSRPLRDSIPGRPARSQSLYRLSHPAHKGKGKGKGHPIRGREGPEVE